MMRKLAIVLSLALLSAIAARAQLTFTGVGSFGGAAAVNPSNSSCLLVPGIILPCQDQLVLVPMLIGGF
jgi:hypothetical protein